MERRRHSRVPVALLGRYMLADLQEYPCQIVDLSPGGGLMVAPVKGKVGERVVVYLELLGRIEGEVTRHTAEGFAFSIAAAMRKRDKIASQLTWLANRQALGLPEDRRHERITPRSTSNVLTLESGHEYGVRIIDVSLSGAALSIEQKLPLGTSVVLVGYCVWAFETAAFSDEGSIPWFELSILPFVVAVLRYAMLLDRGAGGTPEELFFRDRPLQLAGAAWAAVYGTAIYLT